MLLPSGIVKAQAKMARANLSAVLVMHRPPLSQVVIAVVHFLRQLLLAVAVVDRQWSVGGWVVAVE
jgi:hypothetical protein